MERDGIFEVTPDHRFVYRCLSDVQAKPVQWLWPGRIARAKLIVIAGHPGLGKSQLTVSIAAIVSVGGQWPVDRTRCEIGSVVILSAEDDPEDTIRPRLEAAGAELKRCYILDAVKGVGVAGNPYQRAFSLKSDLERLGEVLSSTGDVRLVVVGPISAYLGDTDSRKNAEVRTLLAPLGELAARHGVAVVAISHFNKCGHEGALMRVMGSLAFVAAARAAYAVVKHQDDPHRRLFRICIDRLLPALKSEALPVTLEDIGGRLSEQGAGILRAAGEGEISPDQAATLMQALARQTHIVEVDELERRLTALEERAKLLNHGSPTWRKGSQIG